MLGLQNQDVVCFLLGRNWLLNILFTFNDINNQQDATTFSFINLFKSALNVSGGKFAHPQEHFLTLYTAFGTMHRHCCQQVPWLRWNFVPSQPWHLSAAVPMHCTKSCVYSQKCSWGWANLSPETCRADLKRLINERLLHLVGYLLRWNEVACMYIGFSLSPFHWQILVNTFIKFRV